MLSGINIQNILEAFGVISGITCFYLAGKNNIWCWPTTIISSICYMIVSLDAKLYADTCLELYFIITGFYGWYFWNRYTTSGVRAPIRYLKSKEIKLLIVAVIAFSVLLGLLLKYYTDASFPLIDSFCTVCSVFATIFLARKIMENWLLWILVDTIYIGIYIAKDLNMMAAMGMFYIYVYITAYRDWKKECRLQNINTVEEALSEYA